MPETIILSIIHFILSFILLFIVLRAYLREKHPAIFYLALAFGMLALGDVLFEIYFYSNKMEVWWIDKIFDILALIVFIIAVKKAS